MKKPNKVQFKNVKNLPFAAMDWIGSSSSLVTHTAVFAGAFLLIIFGADFNKVMLVLTTAVSLEAIYLAIFIQMSVNRNTQSLEEVEEDIDEIQEDVQGLEQDVDKIEKDIDEIQEDVDDIEKDDDQHLLHGKKTQDVLVMIQGELSRLMKEIESIKKERK